MADSSADMNSAIDSAFENVAETPSSAVEASVETGTDLPSDEAAEPQEAAPEAQEAPVAEPPVGPPAQPEEEPDPDDDLSNPDRMSRDGKLHYYKPSRIAKFKQAYEAWRTVQEAVPGATVDVIRENYNTAAATDEMVADFHSGNVEPFVKFWAEENPQTFTQVMMNAPQYLAQNNPQAYHALETRLLTKKIDALYRDGQQKNDPNLIAVAQNLDLMTTGKFRDMTKAQPVDMLAEREAELSRREQAIQQQIQRERMGRTQAFLQAADTAAEQAVTGLVEKAFQRPELKMFEGKPQMKWMKRDLLEKIKEAENANAPWLQQYNAQRKQAEARPSEQSKTALVAKKEQFAKEVIARHLKRVIDDATGDILSKSAAAHSKRSAAAARTEPANAAAPVQGVQVNQKLNSAKTMDEVFSAIGW